MSDGWLKHGDSNQRDLVKMLLPDHGVHFMVGDPGIAKAVAAEVAVAVAGGELPSAHNGGGKTFRFERGFLNLPVGKPRAVCIVGATDKAHIDAAAALRYISAPLPILSREDAKSDLAANGFIQKARDNDVALAIVALDLGDKGGLGLARKYSAFENECAVLIVTPSEPPKNLLTREARVLRIEEHQAKIISRSRWREKRSRRAGDVTSIWTQWTWAAPRRGSSWSRRRTLATPSLRQLFLSPRRPILSHAQASWSTRLVRSMVYIPQRRSAGPTGRRL